MSKGPARELTAALPFASVLSEGPREGHVCSAERLDLEGIVGKRMAEPYRPATVWFKIKSRTYTQGEGRWELFQKRT